VKEEGRERVGWLRGLGGDETKVEVEREEMGEGKDTALNFQLGLRIISRR